MSTTVENNFSVNDIDELLDNIEDNVEETIYVSDRTELLKSRLKNMLELFDESFVDLARHLGISYQAMSKKVNGHVDFKLGEVRKIKQYYNLNDTLVKYIFFDEQ